MHPVYVEVAVSMFVPVQCLSMVDYEASHISRRKAVPETKPDPLSTENGPGN